jgi:ribonuclease P protein component
MISRVYTLGTKYYFDRAKKKGKITQGKNIAVAVYDRADQKVSKFGFIISKKISNLATQRNRIRRAMSEAARQNIAFIKPGFDIVFLAKESVAKCSTDEIMKDISTLFKDAKLLK